jgi:hypothetical protein
MRLTIKEYVDMLYPKYKSVARIGLAIGATKSQIEYAIKTNNMKYEIKIKLMRQAIQYRNQMESRI